MKIIFTLILIISFSIIFSAEFIDGKLFLDIHLFESDFFIVDSDSEILLREKNSPFQFSYNNLISIQQVDYSEEKFYAVKINDSKNIPQEIPSYKVFSEKKIWKDGKFAIIDSPELFISENFSSLIEAQDFISQKNILSVEIIEITIPTSRIQIVDSKNEAQYLELPIIISSNSPITLKNQKTELTCNGDFIVKNASKLQIINRIELEDYVMGVIPNEIGPDAPMEALKAQAIAARSETIFKLLCNRHIKDGYDLCSTTHCQVYKGLFRQNDNTKNAVLETSDQIITFDNKVIDAVYSSSCGGKTEDNELVWNGGALPYLRSISDSKSKIPDLSYGSNAKRWIQKKGGSYCASNKNSSSWQKRTFQWEKSITKDNLSKRAGMKSISKIKILQRGKSGRVIKLKISGGSKSKIIDSEYKIRQVLGNLPSSFFYIKRTNPYIFVGKGSGHGVGLCQVGTINQAKAGKSSKEILQFYYQGVEVKKLILDNR